MGIAWELTTIYQASPAGKRWFFFRRNLNSPDKRLPMSHIRLIGLLLFITAITLALAAAATRTTHVQVSGQWLLEPVRQDGKREPSGMESSTTIPTGGSTPTPYTDEHSHPAGDPLEPEHVHAHDWNYAAHQAHSQSTAIPIAWPLLATGGAGLVLWFIQAPTELRQGAKKRSSHRRRRR